MFAYVRLRSLSRKKVLRVRRTATGECKMHEMMTGLSRSVATASQAKSDQIRPNPTKSDQIRPNAAKSNQVKGFRRGTEAVGGTPTVAGGAAPPPHPRGPPPPKPPTPPNNETNSTNRL